MVDRLSLSPFVPATLFMLKHHPILSMARLSEIITMYPIDLLLSIVFRSTSILLDRNSSTRGSRMLHSAMFWPKPIRSVQFATGAGKGHRGWSPHFVY